MDAETEPIRLNSSSQCNVCNMRRRHYLTNKAGAVIAVCNICDCDPQHPIAYTKKDPS